MSSVTEIAPAPKKARNSRFPLASTTGDDAGHALIYRGKQEREKRTNEPEATTHLVGRKIYRNPYEPRKTLGVELGTHWYFPPQSLEGHQPHPVTNRPKQAEPNSRLGPKGALAAKGTRSRY
mmetsp:Transcript_21549/g.43269  ORF Transcript_21549/g.43269 Transcript_21549/m.43269 type:complete len:122 (-) Transcript_21549:1087-1452(-)